MRFNPYQTLAVNVIEVANGAIDAEDICNTHLRHEASVRSVSILYYPGATGFVIVAAIPLTELNSEFVNVFIAMFATLIVFTLLDGWRLRW